MVCELLCSVHVSDEHQNKYKYMCIDKATSKAAPYAGVGALVHPFSYALHRLLYWRPVECARTKFIEEIDTYLRVH
jgi:hypothetical protein